MLADLLVVPSVLRLVLPSAWMLECPLMGKTLADLLVVPLVLQLVVTVMSRREPDRVSVGIIGIIMNTTSSIHQTHTKSLTVVVGAAVGGAAVILQSGGKSSLFLPLHSSKVLQQLFKFEVTGSDVVDPIS
jgi:hypothetical protein